MDIKFEDITFDTRKLKSYINNLNIKLPYYMTFLFVNAIDEINGQTILMKSVIYHNEEVEYLIDMGANVNAKDNKGYTAFIYAVTNNNLDTVKLLIKKGADINIINVRDKTALDYAIDNGNTEIADYLKLMGGKTGDELESGESNK